MRLNEWRRTWHGLNEHKRGAKTYAFSCSIDMHSRAEMPARKKRREKTGAVAGLGKDRAVSGRWLLPAGQCTGRTIATQRLRLARRAQHFRFGCRLGRLLGLHDDFLNAL